MDNDQIFGICTLTKFSYKGVLTHSESIRYTTLCCILNRYQCVYCIINYNWIYAVYRLKYTSCYGLIRISIQVENDKRQTASTSDLPTFLVQPQGDYEIMSNWILNKVIQENSDRINIIIFILNRLHK